MTFENIPHNILLRAIEMEMNERMNQLPFELPEPTLSEKFTKRIDKLKKRSKHSRLIKYSIRVAKRVAILFLTLLTISTITILSVEALREQLFQFIIERYEEFSQIYFVSTTSDHSSQARTLTVVRVPQYIPAGFEQVNFVSDPDFMMIEYEDSKGCLIVYFQEDQSGSGKRKINTEGIHFEEIQINGDTAYFYSNHGVQTLFWYDETALYVLESELPIAGLIKIAQSV